MNAKEIISAVNNTTFTGDELRELIEAVKSARSHTSAVAATAFRTGQRVSFKGRYGETIEGIVMKVNRTTCSVRTDTGARWKCAASILQPVAGDHSISEANARMTDGGLA